MHEEETTDHSNLITLTGTKKTPLPYTPPALTILENSTIEGNVGSGSDAGGYLGHHHS